MPTTLQYLVDTSLNRGQP